MYIKPRIFCLWTKTAFLVRQRYDLIWAQFILHVCLYCKYCLSDLLFFTDPYVHVSFLHVSKTTEIVKSSLNPTWDQTLIFDDIEIYGDPQTIAHNPPSVVLEVYDNDQVVWLSVNPNSGLQRIFKKHCMLWSWSMDVLQGKDEPMGRCTCPPVVKLNPATPLTSKLLWFAITMKGRNAGEMLVAAELLLKDKVVYILTCHVLIFFSLYTSVLF